jgi:hypothetical protein
MVEPLPKDQNVPAYPPEDYKGTQADWLVACNERGIERGQFISQKMWWDILEQCEKGR